MQENEKDENVDMENDAGPSQAEVFQALEAALKWFEKQIQCDTESLLHLK